MRGKPWAFFGNLWKKHQLQNCRNSQRLSQCITAKKKKPTINDSWLVHREGSDFSNASQTHLSHNLYRTSRGCESQDRQISPWNVAAPRGYGAPGFQDFQKKKGQKVVNFLHVRLISRWSIIYVYIYICVYVYIYYIYIICNHIYFNISIRYLKNRCILFLSKNQICRMQIFFSKLAWLACQVRSANGMESMAELRVLHLRDFWNLFCWQVSRKNHWQKKWKLGINRVWDF